MSPIAPAVSALAAVIVMCTVAVATVRKPQAPISIAQDAGVPVRDHLNQLLDEACEVHGCADAGVEDGNGRI